MFSLCADSNSTSDYDLPKGRVDVHCKLCKIVLELFCLPFKVARFLSIIIFQLVVKRFILIVFHQALQVNPSFNPLNPSLILATLNRLSLE